MSSHWPILLRNWLALGMSKQFLPICRYGLIPDSRTLVTNICLAGSIPGHLQLAGRRHLRLPSIPNFPRHRAPFWLGFLRRRRFYHANTQKRKSARPYDGGSGVALSERQRNHQRNQKQPLSGLNCLLNKIERTRTVIIREIANTCSGCGALSVGAWQRGGVV